MLSALVGSRRLPGLGHYSSSGPLGLASQTLCKFNVLMHGGEFTRRATLVITLVQIDAQHHKQLRGQRNPTRHAANNVPPLAWDLAWVGS